MDSTDVGIIGSIARLCELVRKCGDDEDSKALLLVILSHYN